MRLMLQQRAVYVKNINLILISQIYFDAPEQRAPAH